jgi:NAD/NADP transhydrogenase alpha subunit
MSGNNNRPLQKKQKARLILISLTLCMALTVLLAAWLWLRQPTIQTLTAVLIALGLLIGDAIWLVRFKNLAGLTRLQAVIAWLVYHSAVIPMIMLASRFAQAKFKVYLLGQAALLLIGVLTLLGISWLDRRMNNLNKE